MPIITFPELCDIVAKANGLKADFWHEDPIYIKLGDYPDRRAVETVPFHVPDDIGLAVDVNSNGEALGVEFV